MPGGNELDSDYEDEPNGEQQEEEEQLPQNLPDNVDARLHPHGFVWTPNHHQNVDIAHGKYTGRGFYIRWNDDARGTHDERSAYEYFMKSFPRKMWDDIVIETNLQLLILQRAESTKGEIVKCWGMRASMVLERLSVDAAFTTQPVAGSAQVPANYQERYGMSKDRFQILERCMRYGPAAPDDAWCQVRALVNAFNQHRADEISPGEYLCVDECMSMWLGKDKKYAEEGCPGLTKIMRKPRGVGVELKACADAESRVMLRLELMEGKATMGAKQWANISAGCGHVLRLTLPWHGTGRTVCGDSAFASVLTAVWCFFYGLFFMGIVKTATTKFPKKYLVDWFEENENMDPRVEGWRGSHLCLHADARLSDFVPANMLSPVHAQSVDVYALCWADRKYKNVISTRGTTLQGTLSRRPRHRVAEDQHGAQFTVKYYKEVKRPQMVQWLFYAFSIIDIHDHFRQGTLAMEENWRTQVWWVRTCASILGMVYVDAYFFMRFSFLKRHNGSTAGMKSLLEFMWCLVHEMVNNEEDREFHVAPRVRRARRNAEEEQRKALAESHVLKPLIDLPFYAAQKARGANARRRCSNLDCKDEKTGKPYKCGFYCAECSPNDALTRRANAGLEGIKVYCGPQTGRSCYLLHLAAHIVIDPDNVDD